MKKIISVGLSGFFAGTLIALITLSIPLSRVEAYAGVMDIVHDPVNYISASVSATENAITAGAGTVTAAMTTAEKIKVFVLDVTARAAVRAIIKRVTESTVNWVNSGFKGNPTYVRDPSKFFLGISDDITGKFLSDTGLSALCTPFKAQVRLALVKNYINDNRRNYSCSLGKIKDNFENFTNDFSQGGWDAWFELTENPQNNPIGSYLAAQNELSSKIGFQNTKYENQLNYGRGFLSFEKCDENETVTAENQAQWSAEFGKQFKIGDCAGRPKTVTPGSVIEGQLEGVLGSGIRQLELAKNFDEVLGAVVTQLLTKAVGAGAGLFDNGKQPAAKPLPSPGQPIIELQGANPMRVIVGTNYIDPGYVAYDVNGKNVSDEVVRDITKITTNRPGEYDAKYSITRNGVIVSEVTRTVIVGTNFDKSDQCLDPGFIAYISIWPNVIDSIKIKLGSINERDGMLKVRMMINAGDKERDYLIAQDKQRIVSDLENVLKKLDDFSGHLDRADEDSINDIIQLQREAAELKNAITALKNAYQCPIPGIDFGEPIPTDVIGGDGGQDECPLPPTDAEKSAAQMAMNEALATLNASIALCPQVAAPASPTCQSLAISVTDSINSQNNPATRAKYYSGENTIGMPFTYIVGPNTNTVSNIIGPGNTWRGTFRVTCPAGGGGGGGGGGQCGAGPHPDQSARVSEARAILAAGGQTWDTSQISCDRFKIVELAVSLIGGTAKTQVKTTGENCNGFSVDKIDFGDGWVYDVLSGAGDGTGAQWLTAECPGGGGGGGGGGGANLSSQLQAERDRYPASLTSFCSNPTGLEPAGCPLGYMLNTVAWNNRASGWGLSQKTSGHRCPSPAGEIACDILQYNPSSSIYDVFSDAENTAGVMWDGPKTAPRPFVAPAAP